MAKARFSRSTPVHIKTFLSQVSLAFPLDWDLNQVAEAGFLRHRQGNKKAREQWLRQSTTAIAEWALYKLATSSEIEARHWAYLEPSSSQGARDSIQSRLSWIVRVADGRLPTWRGKQSPKKVLQSLRNALETIRRLGLDVTFDEVVEYFPRHGPQLEALQALNEATEQTAEQAANEAVAAGRDWATAYVQAGRQGYFELPPSLDRYLTVLEAKLGDLEFELEVEWPEWRIGASSFEAGPEFGKYPKSGSSLQRAIVLTLGKDFAYAHPRPRQAMSGVVQAVCSAWFPEPFSVAHIEELIRPVRREAEQFRPLFQPAGSSKARKSPVKRP
jgi:hypothetical protein